MDIPIYKFVINYLGYIPEIYTKRSCKYLYKNLLTYILIASCRSPDKGYSFYYTGNDLGIINEIPIPVSYLSTLPQTFLNSLSEYNHKDYNNKQKFKSK